MRSVHDDFVDHHGGDCRPGNGVNRDRIRIARVADHHSLIHSNACISGIKTMQLRFRNTNQQDGLMVLEHIGIDNHPLGVEQYLHVDGLARVGGNIHDIDGLEGIAYRLALFAQGANLIGTGGLGNNDARKKLLDASLLNGIGFR